MSRDFWNPDDKRNFSSLPKEARMYSKDDANALREHYKFIGAKQFMIPIMIGTLLGEITNRLLSYKPKYTTIIEERNTNGK